MKGFYEEEALIGFFGNPEEVQDVAASFFLTVEDLTPSAILVVGVFENISNFFTWLADNRYEPEFLD